MSNPLYQMMGQKTPTQNIAEQIQQLKKQYKDPNRAIQDMLNSGKVSQSQYNVAVQKAQQIMRMLGR